MVGKIFATENNRYTIIKALAEGRENANIYLCVDDKAKKWVAKYFYDKHPSANIGLSKNNHYGRRRDGSKQVFNEIRDKSQEFDFIVKHSEIGKYEGKTFIIIEYIDGEVLYDFILRTYNSDKEGAINAVRALAETLAIWHRKGFAHGDPHLENAILQIQDKKHFVKLIDYSQIHHSDFLYCQEYECFSKDPDRRINEDIKNEFKGKLGTGFETSIIELQQELDTDNTLLEEFTRSYQEYMGFDK